MKIMNNMMYRHYLWCFDEFQFTQAEAWLNDMAKKGWQLVSVGKRFAKFIKTVSAGFRYCCVPDYFEYFTEKDKIISEYKQAGWWLVVSRPNILIFCATVNEKVTEIAIRSDDYRKFMKETLRFQCSAFVIIALLGLLTIMWIFVTILRHTDHELLQWIYLALFVVMLIVAGIYKLRGFHFANEIVKKQCGVLSKRNGVYQGTITLAKMIYVLLITNCVVFPLFYFFI